MTRNDFIEEIRLIFDQYIGDHDHETGSTKRFLYCPLSCQGYSKNKTGHFEVNFEKGVCYCHRCVDGASIYSVLKQFKNNDNKEYINNLLRLYFQFYEHTKLSNDASYLEKYSAYDFGFRNGVKPDRDIILSPEQLAFVTSRFPTFSQDEIISTIKRFGFIPVEDNNFKYLSFFNKYIYSYLYTTEGYHKHKGPNPLVTNDKKDYYYNINGYFNENLFMSEGIFDLMTIYLLNPFLNSDKSNYLAFCNRNYKFVYEFLLNSGKFFYKNIYLILDNDVNRNNFITGVLRKLNNDRNNKRFRLYENLYLIEVPRNYIDVNALYLGEHSIDSMITRKIS